MIAVIFEVWPAPGCEDRYLDLAAALKATLYTEADMREQTGPQTPWIVPLPGRTNEAQRTRYDVSVFRGWTLPGAAAGSLAYREADVQVEYVETPTQRPLTATRITRDRSCQLQLPIPDARLAFERYDAIHRDDHGILVSSDRKRITVFRFDPDRFDIELSLALEKPLPGVPIGAEPSGMSRLVLSDGGPRFMNRVSPGVSVVTLTRAELLAGLEGPAMLSFGNTQIEVVSDAALDR